MKINLRLRNGRLTPADEEARELLDTFQDADYVQIDIKNMDKRTILQNKLIHQFCKNVSIELQRQNIGLNSVLKHDTPVSMLAVKELMFKSVVLSLYGKNSTTKLRKSELNLVFDTLILVLGQKGLDTSNLISE